MPFHQTNQKGPFCCRNQPKKADSPDLCDDCNLLFEMPSALGAVGLSAGVTLHLTIAGKWVTIVAMIVGRLWPLSLLTFNAKLIQFEYPREPLVVE